MSHEDYLPIADPGKIELCPHQDCNHTCCDFAAGNFIALYPGELLKAESEAKSVKHLEIVPDGADGHRAICHASDKSSCDGGYKPLDCACYPLFPRVDSAGTITACLKGSKCPLSIADLNDHKTWVELQWTHLVDSVGGLSDWLRSVKLVGYEEIP